jgi:hypothetical protein
LLKKIIILKNPSHIFTFCLLWAMCLCSLNTLAQSPQLDSLRNEPKDSVAREIIHKDTLPVVAETLPKPDSTQGMDSLQIKNEKGDIETTIYYHAEDSIMMDTKLKKAYLYGKAQIKYQDMQLDADQIEIEWEQNVISARGKKDSTGRYKGYPVWKQGPDTYVTDSMRYNMKSKKGIIHGIVTKQGDGFLHGDTAKRTEEAIYLKNGVYTTCNQKHPHFYINARKLKVIPDDKAVTGPFNLVIEDIHTPIGFWMGFFPITDKNKSGILFPTFGENQNRGFSLMRGGYYWAVSPYMAIKFEGDAYANGSYLVDVTDTYLKRYKYRGTALGSYGRMKENFDEDAIVNKIFRVNWQHSTIAKRNGTFTASVNLTSSKQDKAVNNTPSRLNNNSSSSITYSRVFGRTPFSMSMSMRATQNVSAVTVTNNKGAEYAATLPAATFTMNRINPLKRKYGDGNKWFEKIFVNYQGNFNNDFSNRYSYYDASERRMRDDSILQINSNTLNNHILPNAKWTSSHTASVGSTFKFFKYLSVNPSFNNFYNLHGKKYRYMYNYAENGSRPTLNTVDTFSGIWSTYHMNAAIDVNTRIYGTWISKRNGMIKGLRHTILPSVGMVLAPDFSDISTGGYTEVNGYVNNEGIPKKVFQYPSNAPPIGKQAVLNFKLANILEAKLRNKKDTTGTNKYKKTNLLDDLSIAGGYNFVADSLNMKNITLNARTKLFGIFDINFASSFDPYIWYSDSIRYINGRNIIYGGTQINKYRINEGGGPIAKLTTLNFSINARFSPKKKAGQNDPKFKNQQMQSELDYVRANPDQYLDFNVPWTLAVGFTHNYSISPRADAVTTQAITANGDVSLTPKWKITYNTGYNIKEESITYSTFGISRDLHCWQMNMSVSPFGSLRTFMFTINAKSTMLQQLKLNKRSPTYIQ